MQSSSTALRAKPTERLEATRRRGTTLKALTRRKTNAHKSRRKAEAASHAINANLTDLLKSQEVHKELTTRFGVEPTFGEWAAAAHIDLIQLGRHLHYGEECMDKMIRSDIRLVISIARGYYGTKVHLQDIVQRRTYTVSGWFPGTTLEIDTLYKANAHEQAREKEWQQRMIDINSVLKTFTDSRPLP
ncbi:RNA polymerase sigma factor sigB [Tanacetum coccineum]